MTGYKGVFSLYLFITYFIVVYSFDTYNIFAVVKVVLYPVRETPLLTITQSFSWWLMPAPSSVMRSGAAFRANQEQVIKVLLSFCCWFCCLSVRYFLLIFFLIYFWSFYFLLLLFINIVVFFYSSFFVTLPFSLSLLFFLSPFLPFFKFIFIMLNDEDADSLQYSF